MTSQLAGGAAGSPKRIVILGGGPAGVAAAYWLSRPEQKGQFHVTLCTLGWRLGGKCASGRNAEQNYSIEEHGLHMMMGSYHNGFATLRACYLDWRKLKSDPANMFQTWKDAFLPQPLVTMMQNSSSNSIADWDAWQFKFPHLWGEPGDGPLVAGSGEHPLTPDEQLLITMSQWLLSETPPTAPYYQQLQTAMQAVQALFVSASTNTAHVIAQLQSAAAAVQPLTATPPKPEADPAAVIIDWRKWAILADLGIAFAIGFIFDIYNHPGGYDTLNQQDLRPWLQSHGATSAAVNSAPINAFYDLAFAAIDGVSSGPGSVAAGATFRTILEMVFGYRDAPLFKMAAGMGDTVFTPMYDVLIARGVDIRFFSRVTGLTPGVGNVLQQIDISVQATTVGGAPYRPLTRITCANGKQLDVWPNQPDWNQLTDGAALDRAGADFEYSGWTKSYGAISLVAGRDFDIAISALPPAAVQPIGAALTQHSPEWKTALGASRSVGTQSLQLWLKPTTAELGWTAGDTVLTSYAQPYDSWGDMSQVIGSECWPPTSKPGSIGYFCGTVQLLKGPITPVGMDEAVFREASSWMEANLTTIWPNIGSDPVRSTDILQRFDQANFDLSDMYVQTPAGDNVSSRFDPSVPASLTNFYAVGDWTRTRFSGGCFESAIESAMLVSSGISGFPPKNLIKTA